MTMGPYDVTVVIPTIPPRKQLLGRAVRSVLDQTRPAAAMSIATDIYRDGAAVTRQRALAAVKTPLVAFLDDDDEFMPCHLEDLVNHMADTAADYVYSWYQVINDPYGQPMTHDPVFPSTFFTEPWDDNNPRHTTITTLVRTELAQEVGFIGDKTRDTPVSDEDWTFTLGCLAAGAKISHLVKHTWYWHHGTGNTSGRADRW